MPSFRWRRCDLPGTDHATLTTTETGYLLLGHAQFQDPAGPVDLHYSVQISPTWRTEQARVEGLGPQGPLELHIQVQPDGWTLNGRLVPAVAACIDIDLNFTPATNLLSVRRLNLVPGQSAEVVAAWLEFPDSRLKPLRQQYERLPGLRYGYRCPELPFESILQVNEDGFVTSYPPLWEPKPSASQPPAASIAAAGSAPQPTGPMPPAPPAPGAPRRG